MCSGLVPASDRKKPPRLGAVGAVDASVGATLRQAPLRRATRGRRVGDAGCSSGRIRRFRVAHDGVVHFIEGGARGRGSVTDGNARSISTG